MARGSSESISDLFIRLGLSYDELGSGFVNAERTIRDNMTRLSRENTIIDLQARIELTGLDETADAGRILEIRTQALNRQLKNQRDRVRLASAELANMAERTGENSDQTQRARLALEHERLALARLEEQLRSLNDTQGDTNDNAGNFLDQLQAMAGRFAPVVAGITAVVGTLNAAITASRELIEKWRELQQQAYELNMSVNDTENFLRHMRLAGGDIGDFEGYIRGITDAYVKGEFDDPEFIALSKYNAKIVDATGRLKDFKDITEEVYQAWKKAEAAGEGIEFLQLTGGESGIRDAIQYFKRYEEAKEDASRIFDAGLDSQEMHEADRALNRLTMQVEEFKDAAINLITPTTINLVNKLFDVIHDGTEFLSDNKDEIQSWVFVIAEATEKVKSLLNPLGEFKRMLEEIAESSPKLDLEVDNSAVGTTFKAVSDNIEEINNTPLDALKDYLVDIVKSSDFVKRAQEAQIAYNTAVKGAVASWADFRRETGKTVDNNPLSQYAAQRVKDFKDELADVNAEIEHFNQDYDLSIAQLELWRQRELTDKLYVSNEERTAIEELFSAKLEQIEQERADKLEEIRDEVTSHFQTDIHNQIDAIEKEKDAWISAGIEEAEATELAQRLIIKAYEDREEKLNEIRESVERLSRSDLENSFADIDKKKDSWRDAGMEEAEAEILANRLKFEEIDKLEKAFEENRDALWQSDLEKQLARIEKEKQAWIDKGIDEARAEDWASQARAKVFEDAADKINKKIEELESIEKQKSKAIQQFEDDVSRNIDSIWKTSLENRLDEIEREKQAWIDKGLAEVKATKWAEQAKADARRNAAMSVLKSELKEYRAYLEGGYKGLRDYQLKQLYKQGIRPEDLQMTPEQLQSFQRAQMIARNSMLPNMMSDDDKYLAKMAYERNSVAGLYASGLSAPAIGDLDKITGDFNKQADKVIEELNKLANAFSAAREKFGEANAEQSVDRDVPKQAYDWRVETNEQGIPEIKNVPRFEPTPVTSTPAEVPAELTQSTSDIADRFVALVQPLDDVTAKIIDFGTALDNIPAALENVADTNFSFDTSEIFSAFEELVSPMEEVNGQFAELTNQLIEVTSGFADFVSALNQFSESQQNRSDNRQANIPPPNITVTVQIDEAHAWDSEHIQELADRVANVIEPELVNAIGGDSNRY